MLARGRITPVAVVAALIVMIGALLYAALNRSHAVTPQHPIEQKR
jgi:hypothetical protein